MNLRDLGLEAGDCVRFRRRPEERWKEATVARLERDGSIGLRDSNGAACAIVASAIQVRALGPRGRATWEPLSARIGRSEQLELF